MNFQVEDLVHEKTSSFVTARYKGIQSCMEQLETFKGVVPKPIDMSAAADVSSASNVIRTYFAAICKDCTRELFGMLFSNTFLPSESSWVHTEVDKLGNAVLQLEPSDSSTDAKNAFKQKLCDLNNNLAINVEYNSSTGGVDARVCVLTLQKARGKGEARDEARDEAHVGIYGMTADLKAVLGSEHRTFKFLNSHKITNLLVGITGSMTIAIGYAGDLVSAMAHSQLDFAVSLLAEKKREAKERDARRRGRLEDAYGISLPDSDSDDGERDDGKPKYDSSLLVSLCTLRQRPIQWPQICIDGADATDGAAISRLNQSQLSALSSLSQNMELVCGPPGTGKSTFINALVSTLGEGDDAGCVTAVQNRAVEAIALKFASSGTPFVTFGSRLTPEVFKFTLQEQVNRDAAVVASNLRVNASMRLSSSVNLKIRKFREATTTRPPPRRRSGTRSSPSWWIGLCATLATPSLTSLWRTGCNVGVILRPHLQPRGQLQWCHR